MRRVMLPMLLCSFACGGDDTTAPLADTGGGEGTTTGDGPGDTGPTSSGSADSTGADDTGSGGVEGCEPVEPEIPPGFHVSPGGTPEGDGSEASPWDLATALAHPAGVDPGAIVYLHEGVYEGGFMGELVGTREAKITVRSYPGEWAVIDGATAQDNALAVWGSHTVYRDFEITNTDPERFGGRSQGIYVYGAEVEIVNLVIHDGGGNGFWDSAVDAVMYGNLIYHNGYDDEDRPHGHAIYTQNSEGTKEIAENILFGNYSFGIHAYTEGGQIQGFDFIGNIWFAASIAAAGEGDHKDNFLIGGTENPAARVLLAQNIGYAPGPDHRSVRLGYSADNEDVTLEGNDFVGQTSFPTPWSSITMTDNRFYGSVEGVDVAQHPDNEYDPAVSEPRVFVRANRYDPGRFHVAVYNPGLEATVAVELDGLVPAPSQLVVRNAQDYLGAAVDEVVYEGSAVELPMEGLLAVQPIGNPEAIAESEQTGPAFQVFVIHATPCQ